MKILSHLYCGNLINDKRRPHVQLLEPEINQPSVLFYLSYLPLTSRHLMELNEESLIFLSKLLSHKSVHDATDFNILDCRRFWHSENVVEWFQSKGYTTYKPYSPTTFCDNPRLPFENYHECDYPFAYHQTVDDLAARDTTVRSKLFLKSRCIHSPMTAGKNHIRSGLSEKTRCN